jgi:hypothetical protein
LLNGLDQGRNSLGVQPVSALHRHH